MIFETFQLPVYFSEHENFLMCRVTQVISAQKVLEEEHITSDIYVIPSKTNTVMLQKVLIKILHQLTVTLVTLHKKLLTFINLFTILI